MVGSVYVAVPGGLRGQGGIDRQMQYFFQAAAEAGLDSQITLLVSRGNGSLASSMLLLPFRLARYGLDCALGRVRLLHANISVKGSTYRKLCFVLVSQLFSIPVVLHLHGSDYVVFFGHLTGLRREAVTRLFRSAHRVIALGAGWRDFLVKEVGVAPERVSIIPNAVPGPRHRRGAAAGTGAPHVLFLGRLGARKRVGDLLAALAAAPVRALDWTATIAGDGDVDTYRAQAKRLGLEGRVSFPGWTEPGETDRLLASADILVLPSEAENLPMAILEGMAHGLAIVATPVGAIPEVIEPDVTGLLVPVGNVDALSSAIRALLLDEGLRRRLGAGARRLYEERFALASYVQQLFALYDEIANERRKKPRSRADARC